LALAAAALLPWCLWSAAIGRLWLVDDWALLLASILCAVSALGLVVWLLRLCLR
jgi:hypothetical protein